MGPKERSGYGERYSLPARACSGAVVVWVSFLQGLTGETKGQEDRLVFIATVLVVSLHLLTFLLLSLVFAWRTQDSGQGEARQDTLRRVQRRRVQE